jgi:hypothetical protein
MHERPGLTVAVVMRREHLSGVAAKWMSWRWVLDDVVPHDRLCLPEGITSPFRLENASDPEGGDGAERSDAATGPDGTATGPDGTVFAPALPAAGGVAASAYWMFPHFRVELFRDDAEGLYLNLTTAQPCFWVLWRHEHERDPDALPQPQVVTLSYHDAGRWLDAQERVDQVPAPADVIDWTRAFVAEHYRPEPKRRRRPQSFEPLTDRFGNPARVATTKERGAGGHRGE